VAECSKLDNFILMLALKINPSQIFNTSPTQFNEFAMNLFYMQAEENQVYRNYLKHLKVNPAQISTITDIPCIPIQLYKTQKVITGTHPSEIIFESSSTTGQIPSKHYVKDLQIYQGSILCGFEYFFGPISDYCFLALLPSYIERKNASLLYMVDYLMTKSMHPTNDFYLDNLDELADTLKKMQKLKQKTIFFGVSFALCNFAKQYSIDLSNIIIMETGGMKTNNKEITRKELHKIIQDKLNVKTIYGEYGMTELLSQSYSMGEGNYKSPPWKKILIRDIQDPFEYVDHGNLGAINVIDLANINSCAFIATDDIGKINDKSNFEILGRLDHSDIRGCNLLI